MIETNPSQMIASQEVHVLAIGINSNAGLLDLTGEHFKVEKIDALEAGMQQLREADYDIVFMSDSALQGETVHVVREFKRRYPILPLCIVTERDDMNFLTELMSAGVDDILAQDLSGAQAEQRILLQMRQRKQNRLQAHRNATLHSVTIHSQRLHQAETPTELLRAIVEVVCGYLGHYGVAVAIEEGRQQHLYAGTEKHKRNLFESIIALDPLSPMGQVLGSQSLRIFNDLKGLEEADTYIPISVLSDAQSAIVLPLKYGNQMMGVLGIFSTEKDSFSFDDLAAYELLTSHFGSAYYNAHHYEVAFNSVRASRYSLNAWQRLTNLYDMVEVTNTLTDLLNGVDGVSNVLVWVDSLMTQDGHIFMNGSNEDGINALDAMHRRGELRQLIDDRFNDQMRPRIYWQKNSLHEVIRPLFKALQGQQLLFAPLIGSMQTILGGVFISSSSAQEFSVQEINLVESLTHAAAQTVERNTVLDEMQNQKTQLQEQKGRLEAVMTSIREGIFCVDDTGCVVIANPQFSELTGIRPSAVLQKEQSTVIEAIAKLTSNQQEAVNELERSIDQVMSNDYSGENYPIVELYFVEQDTHISIEFANINPNDHSQGWVGFVRDMSQSNALVQQSANQELLSTLIEDIGIPYTSLHQEIVTLREHHGDIGFRKREQLLEQLEQNVGSAERMWSNFAQLYNVEISGIELERVQVDPADLVDDVLRSRRMSKYFGLISVQRQPPSVTVDVDERHLKQAIINLIEYMMDVSGGNARITMHVKPEAENVLIVLQDKGPGLTEQQLNTLFEPMTDGAMTGGLSQIGVFLAQKLIMQHEGTLQVESSLGMGIIFEISLPTLETNAVAESSRITAANTDGKALSIMIVEGRKRLLESAHTIIQRQRHELFIERNSRNALRTLGLTHLHVVLVETDALDMDAMELCQQIRKQSEVPIIIVSDKDREEERIDALQQGADYIGLPMSEKEFLARIQKSAQQAVTGGAPEPPLEVGDVYINFSQRRVYLDGQAIELTAKEYDLLKVLAMNKDQVLTHHQLLSKVWGPEYRDATQYLWVNVSRLRKKLEPNKNSPRYIHTEPGTGYVFREP